MFGLKVSQAGPGFALGNDVNGMRWFHTIGFLEDVAIAEFKCLDGPPIYACCGAVFGGQRPFMLRGAQT